MALWREKQTLQSYDTFFNDYIDIDSLASSSDTTPDSVYANRLRALVSPVQLPFNPIVKNYIRRYVDTRYGTINRVLSLSRYYFPLIEEELIKADLPVELRALPIIESALSTTATSPMGAVGLWQFMPATGKSYGLEINSFVDERRDPVQATRAACRYLKDLYGIYHDWTLAIAAYNCGPGNVNKALARAGGGTTFWDIYEYLPRETRGYVPAFVGSLLWPMPPPAARYPERKTRPSAGDRYDPRTAERSGNRSQLDACLLCGDLHLRYGGFRLGAEFDRTPVAGRRGEGEAVGA